MAQKVVITGIGVISCNAIGAARFAEALRNGESGIRRQVSRLNEGFNAYYLGAVQGFEPEGWIWNQNPGQLGKAAKFTVAAARMALEDAGMSPELVQSLRGGVCIGTTDGEAIGMEERIRQSLEQDLESMDVSPACIRNMPPHAISAAVAREFGLRGEVMTLTTACAAGNYAAGYGYDLLRGGEADFMLCGGVDILTRRIVAGFSRLGSVAPFVCQPFDMERKGLIPSEGACVLVLETVDSALRRGARIYAEVLGYGVSCDASHITAPDAGGIVRAMRMAHEMAGVRPEQIDYISAHGTGTSLNDTTEVKALREVFGDHLPPVSSIKSMIGHSFGAAGALGLAACALAITHGFIPPTINHLVPDPELDIDCVPNIARDCEVNVVQNNAFAFGGNNAIVILGRNADGE